MTHSPKIILLMTLSLLGTTAAIIFACLEPPFSANFQISTGFIFFAEFMLGGFCIQQIGRRKTSLPLSIGVWGINLAYLAWVLVLTLFTESQTKYFSLWQIIGLSVFVIAHVLFRIAEHHVEERAKGNEPARKN